MMGAAIISSKMVDKRVFGIKTLKQLKPGEKGIVANIEVKGAVRRRLIDMGITPGAEVIMRNQAPLGDPIIIFVRGYELSLRKKEAEAVTVTAVKGK